MAGANDTTTANAPAADARSVVTSRAWATTVGENAKSTRARRPVAAP